MMKEKTSDWQIDHGGGFPSIIWPRGDIEEHDVDSVECRCMPKLLDGMLVHNAFDCREARERQGAETQ